MMYLIIAAILVTAVNAAPQNSSKIVGGFLATYGQFPYMASLKTAKNELVCGGSIISNRWVLTAAHCNHPLVVLIGVGNNYLPAQTNYGISKVVAFPYYNEETVLYDIMLVKTSQTIVFNRVTVQPVTISTDLNADNSPISNMKLSGWGQTNSGPMNPYDSPNYLQWTYFTSETSVTCSNKNTEGGIGLPYNPYLQICATAQYMYQSDNGACFGDSGGPLVYNGVQYGIISRGMGRNENSALCAAGYPDVFTRVSVFSDWIAYVILSG